MSRTSSAESGSSSAIDLDEGVRVPDLERLAHREEQDEVALAVLGLRDRRRSSRRSAASRTMRPLTSHERSSAPAEHHQILLDRLLALDAAQILVARGDPLAELAQILALEGGEAGAVTSRVTITTLPALAWRVSASPSAGSKPSSAMMRRWRVWIVARKSDGTETRPFLSIAFSARPRKRSEIANLFAPSAGGGSRRSIRPATRATQVAPASQGAIMGLVWAQMVFDGLG